MHKHMTALAVATAMGLGTLALPAGAQVSPFEGDDTLDLEASDLDILRRKGGEFHENGSEVGATQEWSNDDTGNSGTMKLLAKFERDGMPCVRIGHNFKIRDTEDPQKLVLQECRTADGEWKYLF